MADVLKRFVADILDRWEFSDGAYAISLLVLGAACAYSLRSLARGRRRSCLGLALGAATCAVGGYGLGWGLCHLAFVAVMHLAPGFHLRYHPQLVQEAAHMGAALGAAAGALYGAVRGGRPVAAGAAGSADKPPPAGETDA